MAARRQWAPSPLAGPRKGGGEQKNHAARLNLTPHSSNPSPETLQPLALAASRTFAISATLNVRPVMRSAAPCTNRKLAFGNFSSGPPLAFRLTVTPTL